MPPKKYLIATLFIAAMLVIMAVVQAPRSTRDGGAASETPIALSLETFQKLAELRLQDGWSPHFQGTRDPDQWEPWPFGGGFGAPWEPASPYLEDQGVSLNGPGGRSEVALWRGLEWRRYRFSLPISSARLDPAKGNRLLVTLMHGEGHYETRLLELPEGRVIWSVDSGPWSRFSWDGKAVLLGLTAPTPLRALLLTVLPVDREPGDRTFTLWKNPSFGKNGPTRSEQLWDDGQDLPGPRLLVPWNPGSHVWLPCKDTLWVCDGELWSCWRLNDGAWKCLEEGAGVLAAHPPDGMGRISLEKGDIAVRHLAPADKPDWKRLGDEIGPWPVYDPAWVWKGPDGAVNPWDVRWGKPLDLPKEHQREALAEVYRSEWQMASDLRASVRGWLPSGPEIALRETSSVAWVWVGDRILLVRLPSLDRSRGLKALLGSP